MAYNEYMELATLHLDTYKVVKLLQTKGYSEAEAEGFIQAIREITLTGVATKSDINDLRNDMLRFQVVQTVALVGTMIALLQVF
jgi:hypothetical protein